MADIDGAATFPKGIALGDNDDLGIFHGTDDPSGGAGEVAPIGSLFLRTNGEVWQKTSAPAIGWTQLSAAGGGPIGVDDLTDADTTTATPEVGDNLKWDGTNWVPSNAVGGITSSSNYFFVYKTLVQQVTARATFEDITFDQEAYVQGWTHVPGSAEFTCDSDGMYIGTLEIGVEKAGGNGVESAIRAVTDASGSFAEVPGSHNGMDITSNNTIFAISRTFIFQATVGNIIKMQYATDSNGSFNVTNSAKITPVPTANADISTVSATFVIRRMT